MERQEVGSSAALPRLFQEESWRDLLPEAIHGPLRQAAQDFFQSAVSAPEEEIKDTLRKREAAGKKFYDQLNSDVLESLSNNPIVLSQLEADYGALLMRMVSTSSGTARDGVLRDITLAKTKLITKEERAPLTRGLRGLIQKAGGQWATGLLKPGSNEARLQTVEKAVLQRLGHRDLRSLFEAKEEKPQQVLEKFMGENQEAVLDTAIGATGDKDTEGVSEREEQIRNLAERTRDWLKRVDWKFVGKGTASMLTGIGLSGLVRGASWMGGVLLGVNMLLRRVQGAEKVEGFIKSREAKYPKASERMASRVVMTVAMRELELFRLALKAVQSPEAFFVGAGLVAGPVVRQVATMIGARAIHQVGGGGEDGGGATGGLSPDERVSGAGVYPQSPDMTELRGQPPADVATANEAVQQAAQQAEAAAQVAAEQVAAAAAQAAEAAKHAAEASAATSVGMTGADLSGGTIWGNELQFARQLGAHHIEPATNLLKNFAKVLSQSQPPTAIGPTDTAYVINRDVAGWAVGQMDKLYQMDPSSMSAWQKGLWEIGRGLRQANWQDLRAVTEEFVKQAQP